MSYKVKLNIFQGPLDLLLFLIKREKIDIYDIPIASVTEQYVEYMELMQLLDLDIAGEFLVMAATLMHIKSKMLLPPEEGEGEEDVEEEDPRDELVRRLLEYKKYKDAADQLKNIYEDQKSVFLRRGSGEKETIVTEDGSKYFEASLFDLITAFRKVLKTIPKETFHEVIKDRFSVREKMHEIYHILANDKRVVFTALFSNSSSKDEFIATFLAVLELIKMREIFVVQSDRFSEIEIIRNEEVIRSKE